jgi:hypothetical protein
VGGRLGRSRSNPTRALGACERAWPFARRLCARAAPCYRIGQNRTRRSPPRFRGPRALESGAPPRLAPRPSRRPDWACRRDRPARAATAAGLRGSGRSGLDAGARVGRMSGSRFSLTACCDAGMVGSRGPGVVCPGRFRLRCVPDFRRGACEALCVWRARWVRMRLVGWGSA